MKNPIKRLYDWVLSWAQTPYGVWALFLLAVAESSFFPVPPDVLLVALVIAIPLKAFRYALICSIGSVAGGCLGYLIGWQLYEIIGRPIIDLYQLNDSFQKVGKLYDENAFWAVMVAGFTPIPYKVFTIAAGVFRVDFTVFVVASAISRSARFFLVAAILYFIGPKAKIFIDKYFNLLTIAFVILAILGFIMIKYLC
ncbi:MAG: DedA family protein [Planctomycetes bacterium]|nr:DedA family protein [Planctomycetota bacterium]